MPINQEGDRSIGEFTNERRDDCIHFGKLWMQDGVVDPREFMGFIDSIAFGKMTFCDLGGIRTIDATRNCHLRHYDQRVIHNKLED